MEASFLIYGATGYTGSLIARESAARAMQPILAGRDASSVRSLAAELALPHRVFSLDDRATVDANLRGVQAVLHCAGPFVHTWEPMAHACLRSGAHYLDITGEMSVFAGLAALDQTARENGVMLLPGVGFDVVPTDCLAVHLKQRLPSATHLTLAFRSGTRASRGTALTVLEGVGAAGFIRKNGVLKKVRPACKTRLIDFGKGRTLAMAIPWGDLVTAYHSTGIPNIEVYLEATAPVIQTVKLSPLWGWLLQTQPLKGWAQRKIRRGIPGPSAEERGRGRSVFWGEVADDQGGWAAARLHGPQSYTMTVHTALAAVERVLAGHAPAGFQTPALAFGPDFILGVKGCTREVV